MTFSNLKGRRYFARLTKKKYELENNIYLLYRLVIASMNDIGLLFKMKQEDTRPAIFKTS